MPRPEWRDPAKERRWRRLLRQWRRSGLTGRDCCSQHSLPEPSFYAWKREIAKRDQARRTASQATARGSAQAPRPSADALPAFPPVTVHAVASSALKVVLSGGRLLRVHGGFDAEVLRQLVAVLEERSC